VVLLALIVGYQILVATRDGVAISTTNIWIRYAPGGKRMAVVREVLLPAALPMALQPAPKYRNQRCGSISGGIFCHTEGLGYLIMDAWGRMAYVQMFTGSSE